MHHFDEIAKALASGLTRRQALRRVGGGLAGAMLASLGLGKAWGATPKNCADFCKNFVGINPGNGNAYGKCVSNCAHCVNSGGIACGASACCKGGSTSSCCSGTCVDLSSGNNCGACGNACLAGFSCCSGMCVDLSSDKSNCGACGTVCDAGSSCVGGVCVKPPSNCCTPANSWPNALTVCGTCQDTSLGSGQTTSYCWTRKDGGTFCGANYDNCGETPTCNSDADCPAGHYCTDGTDFCGVPICRMVCNCA